MSDNQHKQEQAAKRERTSDHSMSFDCCGTRMGDAIAGCPCGSVIRKHPVVTSVMLAVMGLAVLVIPVAAILGTIAFLRTI